MAKLDNRRPVRGGPVVAIALVQVLVASSLLGYRWIASSTEPSVDDAIARFAGHEVAQAPAEHGERVDSRGQGSPDGGPLTSEPEAPDPRVDQEITTSAPETSGPEVVAISRSFSAPPEPGVYVWATEGSERAGGIDRDLPERSVRTITHEGSASWTERIEYSSEHVEELLYLMSPEGVHHASHRMTLSFGPITRQNDMPLEPPMLHAVFPFELHQRWHGGWSGETSGTYTGQTIDQAVVAIGDEDVEVWVTDVRSELGGHAEGRVDTVLWYSPKYRMTVREVWDMELRQGNLTYRGSWTTTLLSADPQR